MSPNTHREFDASSNIHTQKFAYGQIIIEETQSKTFIIITSLGISNKYYEKMSTSRHDDIIEIDVEYNCILVKCNVSINT